MGHRTRQESSGLIEKAHLSYTELLLHVSLVEHPCQNCKTYSCIMFLALYSPPHLTQHLLGSFKSRKMTQLKKAILCCEVVKLHPRKRRADPEGGIHWMGYRGGEFQEEKKRNEEVGWERHRNEKGDMN